MREGEREKEKGKRKIISLNEESEERLFPSAKRKYECIPHVLSESEHN